MDSVNSLQTNGVVGVTTAAGTTATSPNGTAAVVTPGSGNAPQGNVDSSPAGAGSQNGSSGSGRSTPSSDTSPGKLFVGGLSWQTTPDKLREYFGQFGSVTDVLVMKDPVTQVRKKKHFQPFILQRPRRK